MTPTPEARTALRALAEQATKGPWEASNMEAREDGSPGCAWGVTAGDRGIIEHDFVAPHNAVFIAAANPAVVLALLDALEARDREVTELRSWLTLPCTVCGAYLEPLPPTPPQTEEK